ncbi:MAG: pyruvate formate lyase family protein [Candidatus Latescibacteria bacterium]|jgi:formate C-acetyltransferase|nr:pyruvate formate lyase family protein [Candidatus Latescibacterota bacterium]
MAAIPPEVIDRIDPKALAELGETFASGYFEEPGAAPVVRMARAARRQLEQVALPEWEGTDLYPSGPYSIWARDKAVFFTFSHSMGYNRSRLEALREAHPEYAEMLDALDTAMSATFKVGSEIPQQFWVGGDGYTHSIPNFGRIIREGLSSYGDRIEERLLAARDREDSDRIAFYEAMQDVLAGIAAFHRRCLDAMSRSDRGDAATIGGPRSALERVPFEPGRNFYEGLVSENFIFYLDGCDSLGRFDQDLGELYERDLTEGTLTAEEGERLVRQMWENVDANSGWNTALGGSLPDGSSAYNGLTLACLRAARGLRRPNLALRVRRDMSEPVFDAALDTIATGCGLPALYNEEGYLAALMGFHLNLQDEDLVDFAFGGCTETMVHGKSNVGSLDAGLNLVGILTETLDRELIGAESFDALLAAYTDDVRDAIALLADSVSRDQELKAQHQPQPMRSLLIDNCIDAGQEYNAGGARYNWSVINVGGMANAVDSLSAIRTLVFEMGEVSGAELLAAMRQDFVGYEVLLKQIQGCPRFGNDRPDVDALAAELSESVFKEFQRYAPWRGGKFLPGCLMFVTYARAGEGVMATPDGRLAGEPIADSAGPVQGRDRSGPTAMLNSVTRLAQELAPGTLVVNARFARSMLDSSEQRSRLKGLIRTYFQNGGMQIQINVVDQTVLKDAIVHPERHEDLIVRIGGYSEYFNRLSPALKASVLERTEHT